MSLKNLSVKNKIPKILIEKLDNKKVNLLYKKFEKSFNLDENFIVAVSGGSDSLALAYLSKIYASEIVGFPKVVDGDTFISSHTKLG